MKVIINSFCLVEGSKIFKGFFRKLCFAPESGKANMEVKDKNICKERNPCKEKEIVVIHYT